MVGKIVVLHEITFVGLAVLQLRRLDISQLFFGLWLVCGKVQLIQYDCEVKLIDRDDHLVEKVENVNLGI